MSGLGIGGIFVVLFASYALGFWFGARCVIGASNCDEDLTGGRYEAGMFLSFFSVLLWGECN